MSVSPMVDIVKYLRSMGEYCRRTTTNSYRYDEAADEIERLRAALHDIVRLFNGDDPLELAAHFMFSVASRTLREQTGTEPVQSHNIEPVSR